ncbi:MAG: F0F1 ATP synthase subunit A [Bacteroidia bacterium]|nr:F0F1 ATP synthase subunit A [Bacteroidia bacterium]
MGHKNTFKNMFKAALTAAAFFLLLFANTGLRANHAEHCENPDVKPSNEVMHHITDNHNWHIASFPVGKCESGETEYFHLEIPLPWLIYNSEKGIQFFMSSAAHENGYEIAEGELYLLGQAPEEEANHGGPEVLEAIEEAAEEHAGVEVEPHGPTILDFSLTRTSFQMILIGLVLLLIFMAVAKGYKKNEDHAPKGIQSFMEPIVMFVRDDIARVYLGKKADKYTPYLLTLFFFIWFSNLLGLTPFNSNIAGSTSVTIALALITFILILANSTKDFWLHIFWFPGVPVPIKFLMMIVEMIGLIVKPTALAIRLFANITAGHFMVLSLISLIFILGKNGAVPAAGWGTAPVAVAFTTAIFALEMIVAIIQAYVFALLTAVFIGQAMETHDHDHDDHH